MTGFLKLILVLSIRLKFFFFNYTSGSFVIFHNKSSVKFYVTFFIYNSFLFNTSRNVFEDMVPCLGVGSTLGLCLKAGTPFGCGVSEEPLLNARLGYEKNPK